VRTANLLIGGEDSPASSGASFRRHNPISGSAVTMAAAASVEDALRAATAAGNAFATWSVTGPSERRALLNRAADILEQRTSVFAAAMLDELGSTAANAARNVRLAVATLREAASLTTHVTGEIIPSDKPGCIAMAVRQAAGVVLGVAPWNAPVVLGVRALAVPLACGNSVILKSSELCPATHRMIGDVFQDAGFPPGVVNVVSNAPADAPRIVEALISDARIRRVNFTGSSKVGRIIGELAARHMKPALLELGGKSPLLVLDDADLESAADAAVFGAFANQGQICMSTERVVVDAAVADALVARLRTRVQKLTVGDPGNAETRLSCLVDAHAAARVRELIGDALERGATLIGGGAAYGPFVRPTVLDHVTAAMRIYHEESFGPVMAVIRVSSDEEAVRIANDSEFGLSASVFSADTARALTIAKRIQSGICHINGATLNNEPQMPFGGVNSSGYGRFGSRAEINEFTDLRWITINTMPERYPA
jgi:acyl-CoA reductase-like NAD-dependent aldehyde dehydrogenase